MQILRFCLDGNLGIASLSMLMKFEVSVSVGRAVNDCLQVLLECSNMDMETRGT